MYSNGNARDEERRTLCVLLHVSGAGKPWFCVQMAPGPDATTVRRVAGRDSSERAGRTRQMPHRRPGAVRDTGDTGEAEQ
eukprot:2990180-Prymnesium_polylepis.1